MYKYNSVSENGQDMEKPPCRLIWAKAQESVCRFLGQLDLKQFTDPFRMEEILDYVDSVAPDNRSAKASVDIALHDLVGKIMGQPWYKIWGLSPKNAPIPPLLSG